MATFRYSWDDHPCAVNGSGAAIPHSVRRAPLISSVPPSSAVAVPVLVSSAVAGVAAAQDQEAIPNAVQKALPQDHRNVSECPACSCQLAAYLAAIPPSRITRRFSAFRSWAALVK